MALKKLAKSIAMGIAVLSFSGDILANTPGCEKPESRKIYQAIRAEIGGYVAPYLTIMFDSKGMCQAVYYLDYNGTKYEVTVQGRRIIKAGEIKEIPNQYLSDSRV